MSVLKVFDMMAGGVEFNHYFVEKDLRMPELARFICFTFILIMSISLMNLLVSISTTDSVILGTLGIVINDMVISQYGESLWSGTN